MYHIYRQVMAFKPCMPRLKSTPATSTRPYSPVHPPAMQSKSGLVYPMLFSVCPLLKLNDVMNEECVWHRASLQSPVTCDWGGCWYLVKRMGEGGRKRG